ncbi:MAG TPA: PHB depolymerase family esterase [Gemmatimonadaceae bacterium]|nr:PHB depolymerase family esterase [Gemmatimonadaceae bacterium]
MIEYTTSLSRRRFLGVAVGGPAALMAAAAAAAGCAGCSKTSQAPFRPTEGDALLRSRPAAPTESVEAGLHELALAPLRDGFLYVPPTYRADQPAPLIVLLHGAGHDANEWASAPLAQLFDDRGIVALIPSSRSSSWDIRFGAFGPDVRFIDSALAQTFRRCNIDPARLALAGFSDGASYALSLGASNGDFFGALMAFSPGFFAPAERKGTPKIYISHGTNDQVLPIDATSRRLVPQLRQLGYQVQYREFTGGHTVTMEVAQEAMAWWLPAPTMSSPR